MIFIIVYLNKLYLNLNVSYISEQKKQSWELKKNIEKGYNFYIYIIGFIIEINFLVVSSEAAKK